MMDDINTRLINARLQGHAWNAIHENIATQFERGATPGQLGYVTGGNLTDRLHFSMAGDMAAEGVSATALPSRTMTQTEFEANLARSRPDLMQAGADKIEPVSMAGEPVGAKNATEFGQQFVSNVAMMTAGGMLLNKTLAPVVDMMKEGGHFIVGKRVAEPIEVLHASPHDFTQFRTTKYGTGEGARLTDEGRGLYFTDLKEVHNFYRGTLGKEPTVGGEKMDFTNPLHNASFQIQMSGSREQAIEHIYNRLEQQGGFVDPADKGALKVLESDKEIPKWDAPLANSYKANLHVDQEKMLDLDKPLSEQSEHVKNALKLSDETETGREYLWNQHLERGHKETADWLSKNDIHGTRYETNPGEGGTGAIGNNYVVFDDARVKMIGKNGEDIPTREYTSAYTGLIDGPGMNAAEDDSGYR